MNTISLSILTRVLRDVGLMTVLLVGKNPPVVMYTGDIALIAWLQTKLPFVNNQGQLVSLFNRGLQ